MTNKSFRSIVHVDGIKTQKSVSLGTYRWRELLQEVQKNFYMKDDQIEEDINKQYVVEVTSLNNPPLSDFLAVMSPDVKVKFCFIFDEMFFFVFSYHFFNLV